MIPKEIFWLICSFFVVCYTQFAFNLSVPGLHFDEAWQAMFAHKIATEPGFFPTSAMNAYTSPILHYFLAFFFKIFSPSLFTLRFFFGLLNILTAALLGSALFKIVRNYTPTLYFFFGWALLPLFVHNHRFYIEVTTFHGLCFSITLWGMLLWNKRPRTSFTLILLAYLFGTYSHVLFISVFFTTLLIGARYFPSALSSLRGKLLIASCSLLSVPLAIRMFFSSLKTLPALLTIFLLSLGCLSIASYYDTKWRNFFLKLSRLAFPLEKFLILLSLPLLFLFSLLFINGFWPYAQATGKIPQLWIPINFIAVGLVIWSYFKKKKTKTSQKENFLLASFLISLLTTQLLVFKPTSRYYTIPSILGLMWVSIYLAELEIPKKLKTIAAILFLTWNIWAFHHDYISAFEEAGPTDKDFNFFIFHDSGRDFRPFQKTFNWAIAMNCQKTLYWLENDRFMYPIHFLQLTAPEELSETESAPCPWDKEDLFLSHTPLTPLDNDHLELLYQDPSWGDLAFFLRNKKK